VPWEALRGADGEREQLRAQRSMRRPSRSHAHTHYPCTTRRSHLQEVQDGHRDRKR
jgi:hypothetical protein